MAVRTRCYLLPKRFLKHSLPFRVKIPPKLSHTAVTTSRNTMTAKPKIDLALANLIGFICALMRIGRGRVTMWVNGNAMESGQYQRQPDSSHFTAVDAIVAANLLTTRTFTASRECGVPIQIEQEASKGI